MPVFVPPNSRRCAGGNQVPAGSDASGDRAADGGVRLRRGTRREGRETCILHVEFFGRHRRTIPTAMARYGGSLCWQHLRPVESVLLLLSEQGAPEEIPEFGELVIGSTKVIHGFRTVKLWEQDPEPVLALGNPALLAWAALMRLGREAAAELAKSVRATGNDLWVARFLTMGSLRYDRREVEEMLGGLRMGLEEAMVEGSWIFHDAEKRAVARGQVEGEARGKELGQAHEARRLLRLALTSRFPGLESMPELDRIAKVDDLEALLLGPVMARADRSAVERAIVLAAGAAQV